MNISRTLALAALFCLFSANAANAEMVLSFTLVKNTPNISNTAMNDVSLYVHNSGSAGNLSFANLTLYAAPESTSAINLSNPTYVSSMNPFSIGAGENKLLADFDFTYTGAGTENYTGTVVFQEYKDPATFPAFQPIQTSNVGVTVTSVPEPTSFMLFGSMAMFGLVRRRTR